MVMSHHIFRPESFAVPYKENVELNKNLEEKVKARTFELNEKNEMIMESIGYAGIIQKSMLPETRDLKSVLSNYYSFE